jgi:hypothetical protein
MSPADCPRSDMDAGYWQVGIGLLEARYNRKNLFRSRLHEGKRAPKVYVPNGGSTWNIVVFSSGRYRI